MLLLKWLSYPRGIVVSLFGAVWTLCMSLVVLLIAFLTRNQRFVDVVTNVFWAKPLTFLAGLDIEVRGAERVSGRGANPKGFLILFNHSSYFDIPILYSRFPRSFRFGAKIELFKVPFFGPAMRACGVLPIDRRNRNKVMKIYDEAIARVNRGECFALAPEGTRQMQPVLGTFKRGPFEFAINAGMDLVPVVLAGAYAALPRNTVWVNLGQWRQKVIVQILEPVSTSTYTLETSQQLQDLVRARMLKVHDELYQELS